MYPNFHPTNLQPLFLVEVSPSNRPAYEVTPPAGLLLLLQPQYNRVELLLHREMARLNEPHLQPRQIKHPVDLLADLVLQHPLPEHDAYQNWLLNPELLHLLLS
jgi:hypothetical protein